MQEYFINMDNQVPITADDFANAIVAVRMPRKSLKAFFEALTSPGRKEKHAGWIEVCEYIRQAKNMSTMNKAWRKEAHALFMENIVEIEKRVWDIIMEIPMMFSNPMDVHAAVTSAMKSISNDGEPVQETAF